MPDQDAAAGHTGGDGLKLGTVSGDSLRLAIAGYQFAEAQDPDQRYSWYLVEGTATATGRGWDFRWQALTCDDAPLISLWLRQLAGWASEHSAGSAPAAPWLIEPNLQFRSVAKSGGVVELVVELDLEFLPPERRQGRTGADNPAVLSLRVTPNELMAAADDFDVTIALFPNHFSRDRRC